MGNRVLSLAQRSKRHEGGRGEGEVGREESWVCLVLPSALFYWLVSFFPLHKRHLRKKKKKE